MDKTILEIHGHWEGTPGRSTGFFRDIKGYISVAIDTQHPPWLSYARVLLLPWNEQSAWCHAGICLVVKIMVPFWVPIINTAPNI